MVITEQPEFSFEMLNKSVNFFRIFKINLSTNIYKKIVALNNRQKILLTFHIKEP